MQFYKPYYHAILQTIYHAILQTNILCKSTNKYTLQIFNPYYSANLQTNSYILLSRFPHHICYPYREKYFRNDSCSLPRPFFLRFVKRRQGAPTILAYPYYPTFRFTKTKTLSHHHHHKKKGTLFIILLLLHHMYTIFLYPRIDNISFHPYARTRRILLPALLLLHPLLSSSLS